MPDAEWMADLLTALLPALTAGAGWAAARLGRSRKTDRALREGVKAAALRARNASQLLRPVHRAGRRRPGCRPYHAQM